MNLKEFPRMRTTIRILFFLSSFLIFIPLSCDLGNLENLQGEIVIENNSAYQVVEFYVALEDSEDWGENLLDTPIEPGESRTITSLPRKDIKVKSVFLDGADRYENINHDPDLLLSSKVTLVLNL